MSSNILVRARTLLGLTQEEMAEAMGLSRSTLQRRERLADLYVPLAERTHARELVRTAVDAALMAEARAGGFEIDEMGDSPPSAASGEPSETMGAEDDIF